jgi:hypothetical protein
LIKDILFENSYKPGKRAVLYSSHFNTVLIRVDHERPPETICTWFFPDGDHVCHDNPVIPEVTLDAQHKSEIIVINQINLNSVHQAMAFHQWLRVGAYA